MKSIKQLIEEFCPNGFKYQKFETVVKHGGFKQMPANIMQKMIDSDSKEVRMLPLSDNLWYTSKTKAGSFLQNGEVVSAGIARYANLKYVKGYFVSSNNHLFTTKDNKILSVKFLFYILSNCIHEFYPEKATYPTLDTAALFITKIPIPPIEVQNKIVEILDKFTKLEAELEAELEARKKQYEYYRDKLLTFPEGGVKMMKLSELQQLNFVFTISPSEKIKKDNYLTSGMFPIIDQGLNFIVGYTNDEKKCFSTINNVIFGDHTEILKYADFKFAQGADGIKVINTDNDVVSAKYLFYCLQNFYKKIGKYERHWKYLISTVIPIPALNIQNKIVNTLDKFSHLITKIEGSLPKEIELCDKQYIYYRNDLLNFKEESN